MFTNSNNKNNINNNNNFTANYHLRIKDTETNFMKYNANPIPRWGTSSFCACNQTGDGVPVAVCSSSMHLDCPTEYSAKDIQCVTYETQAQKVEVERRLKLSDVQPPTTVRVSLVTSYES